MDYTRDISFQNKKVLQIYKLRLQLLSINQILEEILYEKIMVADAVLVNCYNFIPIKLKHALIHVKNSTVLKSKR
jgi:hypothetical protein